MKSDNDMKAFVLGSAVGLVVGGLVGFFKREKVPEFAEEEEILEEVPTLIVIVRKDLKMKKGKIAAQCGHGVLGAALKLQIMFPSITKFWEQSGRPKEFYYCPNEEVMDQKRDLAKQLGLVAKKIHDAGRTQIPAGSATVVVIGPIFSENREALIQGLTPLK